MLLVVHLLLVLGVRWCLVDVLACCFLVIVTGWSKVVAHLSMVLCGWLKLVVDWSSVVDFWSLGVLLVVGD